MKKRKISRRQFLSISAATSAGLIVAACGGDDATSTPVPAEPTEAPKAEPTATTAAAEATMAPEPSGAYQEAPMLAAMVAAGELPPVDERLPKNPWVAPMVEGVGNYGGVVRRGFKGVSDRWGPTKHLDRTLAWYDENLVMQPRFAESWEVSDDATTFTFHLREGAKWSDGTPVTSEQFMWWYDNIVTNTDVNTTPPRWTTTGNPPVVFEPGAPDDYTIVFKFADPNPLFIYEVGRKDRGLFSPFWYLEQFHADFADADELDAKIAESGFNDWTELLDEMRRWWNSSERPVYGGGWSAGNELSSELFLMKRNPYFFGVDPDDKQLPYFDQINHRLFETNEVLNLWIVNGEIDFQNRHVQAANFTLYKENEESGDYKVYIGLSAGHICMQPNHTTKEPKLREFFNDTKVRQALSLAANREEMNELIFDGLQVPRQYSPLPLSPNAYPKLSNAFIEYDPDTANQLLDEAGYTEKDGDGNRLWKDGSGPISWIIEGTEQTGTPTEDAVLLYVKYLADVGLQASYKYSERSLYTEHFEANDIEAAWWGGDRTVVPLAPGAPIFRATMQDRPWGVGWGNWYDFGPDSPNSEEPPEGHWLWDIWSIWDQIASEPDPDTQNTLFEGIMDIWAEQLPMIGFLGEAPAPIIVKNGIKNYKPGMPIDDTTGDEHLLNTETYFWDDPEAHM